MPRTSRVPEVFVYDSEENGALSFGRALLALKAGFRVQRAGWNGKGMWLWLTPGSTVPVTKAVPGSAAGELALKERVVLDPNAPPITICAHIDMRAADGTLVIGWLASQTDMLSSDWSVLTKENS